MSDPRSTLLPACLILMLGSSAPADDLGRPLGTHAGGVASVDFAPDGKLLASGGGDRMVRLWAPATGKEVRALAGTTASSVTSPSRPTVSSSPRPATTRKSTCGTWPPGSCCAGSPDIPTASAASPSRPTA